MTVISHKKKYILVAVFKTGSSSMGRMLQTAHKEKIYSKYHQSRRGRDIYLPDEYGVRERTLHSKSTTIKECLFTEEDNLVWDEYFKFGFVRNPWDREVSNYFFNNKKLTPPKDVSFKEFLDYRLLKDGQIDASNVPQCEYLTDVNYVARFENYAEEVKNIYYKIGLAFPNSLKYTYKTEHKPYWEYYDDADIMKVHEWYEKDIEMYNYEFGE